MPTTKNQKLSSWLLSRPAIFALISFGLMFGATLLAMLVAYFLHMGDTSTRIMIGAATTLAFLTAIAVHVRKLPPHNLDQYSFVAINNAQTVIVSCVFIISIIAIIANAQNIMLRLLWLETHTAPGFVLLMVIGALFYLYLTGIYIGNIYAKYRRVRTLGVPMWRALCTAPFGFAMLWIPGYILPDNTDKEPILTVRSSWYSKLTKWIIGNPTHTAAALTIVLLLLGMFFGFNAMLLSFGLSLVFATWAMCTGIKKFRTNIGGAYTWTAIGINIAAWIIIISLAILAPKLPQNNDVNITINETVEALQNAQQ